jgi:hypothetical protein
MAYLMKSKGWRLAQGYQWVKERRPSVELSEGMLMICFCFIGEDVVNLCKLIGIYNGLEKCNMYGLKAETYNFYSFLFSSHPHFLTFLLSSFLRWCWIACNLVHI